MLFLRFFYTSWPQVTKRRRVEICRRQIRLFRIRRQIPNTQANVDNSTPGANYLWPLLDLLVWVGDSVGWLDTKFGVRQ